MAARAEVCGLGLQQVIRSGWMGVVAVEARFHRSSMGVGHRQPILDGLVAGEAKFLGLLAQQCLSSAVVGGVAGAALPLDRETVVFLFTFDRLLGLVADRTKLAAATSVENVGVRASVGLVAPLAMTFAEGLVRRGRTLQRSSRGMAGHALLVLAAQGESA